ncbi:putative mitochondrial tuzin [Leptomonas pyrrhocoris]|uniref:Putative mitochondrial tuzin n=1 Tax=Leptomonas pyrrhocoris TaxID=157538 RepID=A0A0M9G4T5_LEPPY|nr:putative mitochondrial tuzin [Leptomonas pyrrhocoris]KPA82129.1 putative mitochondrial tuzin [Leptomonas pyrrhocoris]|eukprot:XP_015660568.1 putative mitochondrial tuzin [Leptomonas pyrrhocoris]
MKSAAFMASANLRRIGGPCTAMCALNVLGDAHGRSLGTTSAHRRTSSTRNFATAAELVADSSAAAPSSSSSPGAATPAFSSSLTTTPPPPLPSALQLGMPVSAFFENGTNAAVAPIARGIVKAKIAGTVYAVHLQQLFLSPIIEIGSRVHVEYGKDEEYVGVVMGGIVVRVNGNGTFAVLLDNNSIDIAVPAQMIALSEGRTKFVNNSQFQDVVEWLRTAGVARRSHQESIACVLFQHGWRVDKLYLLEASDVHCMTFIPKAVRMCVLDKSEWQRDHHRQMRQLLKERIKERDFRYRLTKYSGVVSASMAFLGIAFAFGWNVKNYHTQQRSYQLTLAAKTLTERLNRNLSIGMDTTAKDQQFVSREREENAVRQVLHQLDTAHPRIVVFTGFYGCGKSTVCRNAVVKEHIPAVYVDIRGAEDTLRSVVKALGVNNVDICGDLLDFVAEACQMAKAKNGETPLLMLKLREGSSVQRVYNDAVALACDRRLCHLVMEVPLESVTMADVALPRLDFYVIPVFNRAQAFAYTQHSIDPLSLNNFIDVVGTNSNDLDELFAAVHQRRVSASKYTNQKLLKAMRQLQGTCANKPQLRAALQQLSAFPYEEGQNTGGDATTLRNPALEDIVLYDPVKDVWLFRNKLFHTASRCCWL